MISFDEKQQYLSTFPNIKLCYDIIQHNKVDNNYIDKKTYDICLATPCGKKCFAWFTQVENKSVCFIMEIGNNKNILDIKSYPCVFNENLAYGENGTILYGTLFHLNKTNFFTMEDIFYWKGKNIGNQNWLYKFQIFENLFKMDIKQICYNNYYIVFGLPLVANNLDELTQLINDINYKIYNIQFYSFKSIHKIQAISYRKLDTIVSSCSISSSSSINNTNSIKPIPVKDNRNLLKPCKPEKVEKTNTNMNKLIIFNVKPDLQNDIYNLYCIENNEEKFYNVAYIPDFKTSVMMNKLFRNIKENDNLDLLEESDDEEEFQNENLDRFVDLNKSLYMICKFNYKFKKWYPIKEYLVSNNKLNNKDNTILVDKKVLENYERSFSNKTKSNVYICH